MMSLSSQDLLDIDQIRMCLPISPYSEEKFTGKDCIDFRSPSPNRPFPIHVKDTVFYVRVETMATLSPVFAAMLLSDFAEARKGCIHLKEESVEDIEILLQSTCPYYLDIYPKLVNSSTLPILMRLADKFLICGLKDACNHHLSKAQFYGDPPLILLKTFHAVREQNVDIEIQTRILVELLQYSHEELQSMATSLMCSSAGQIVSNLIRNKHLLGHRVCSNEEVQGLQCSNCRIVPNRKRPHRLRFCTDCHSELCPKCQNRICTKVVSRWYGQVHDRY